MKLACDNPQIQVRPRQEFSFDAAATGLAFLIEGTLATGLGDGSVRLIAPGETASPRTVRPHCEGAAVLAMVTDIDGAGVVTGGDHGRVARTDARGEVSVLAEFPGRQTDVLAVSPSGGVRAAAGGREVRLLDRAARRSERRRTTPAPSPGWPSTPKGSGSPYLIMAEPHCDGRENLIREPQSSTGAGRISASLGAPTARQF